MTVERADAPVVSFEFFPPGDEQMEATLWNSVQRLAPLKPRFVSVTYGADGSTRERTHNVITRIQRETQLTGAPHLTCVGASRGEILDIARQYWEQDIRHLVALRGDPPRGYDAYRPHPDGFRLCGRPGRRAEASRRFRHLGRRLSRSASRGAVARIRPRRISSARSTRAPRAPSRSSSTTPTDFCAFAIGARRQGIQAEIVPGILPITRFPQVLRFAAAMRRIDSANRCASDSQGSMTMRRRAG